MAIQTTPHTRDQEDPTQEDFDQNELSDKVGKGYDGQEFQELKDADTGGSRNERVTEYNGNEHKTEPTTVSEYQQNEVKPSKDAVGISNHSLGAEQAEEAKVKGQRPDAIGPVDPKE